MSKEASRAPEDTYLPTYLMVMCGNFVPISYGGVWQLGPLTYGCLWQLGPTNLGWCLAAETPNLWWCAAAWSPKLMVVCGNLVFLTLGGVWQLSSPNV